MFKFRSAIQKETILLLRDRAGLAILFLMPMVLIIIISLLQDFGWNSLLSEPKIQVVVVDKDKDTLGLSIQKGLENSGTFEVVRYIDSVEITEEMLQKSVSSGKYQLGIVIPENATRTIRQNVRVLVTKTLAGFGMINPLVVQLMPVMDTVRVQIYFDPAVKKAFRVAVMSSVREYDLKIQSKMVFQTFNEEMSRLMPFYKPEPIEYMDAVSYETLSPGGRIREEIPNTVQHNVPAWTIFAMFFIVIPFTGSLIKEREEGSLTRLLTLPVSYMNNLMAKVFVYFFVCLIQFILMILAGIFILPLFSLPALQVGTQYFALFVITVATALSALGYGLLVGMITKTHQQAAAFGSVSIIILAALGGIWVPTYLMPHVMKEVATISPLNWSLQAFYDIFLRDASVQSILGPTLKLLTFFGSTVIITSIVYRLKNPTNA